MAEADREKVWNARIETVYSSSSPLPTGLPSRNVPEPLFSFP